MNKKLYQDTKEKLVSYSKNIGDSLFLNQVMSDFTKDWNTYKMNTREAVSVACAYYEVMKDDKRCEKVMEQNVWKQFFADSFKNISSDMLKDSFEFVLSDKAIQDIVLNNCSHDTIKEFLEFAQVETKDSAVQTAFYEEFAKNCEDKGIKLEEKEVQTEIPIESEFKIDETPKTVSSEIDTEQDIAYEEQRLANDLAMIKMQQAELAKKRDAKEAELLTGAASDIGVSKDELANKLGDSIQGVDSIVIEPELLNKICSLDAKAATVPKRLFQTLKTRIQEKRILKNMEIDVVKENGITSLRLAGKETNFDKIATADKKTVKKIKDNIKNKRDALSGVALNGLDKADSLVNIVKTSIKNANEKIRKVLGDIRDLPIRTAIAVSHLGEDISGLAKDVRAGMKEMNYNAKAGIAQGLYNIGDKINPEDLTLRSATKVAEMKPEDLEKTPEEALSAATLKV